MKFTIPILAATAHLTTTALAKTFAQVELTAPYNWVAGTYLFPTEIIAGYHSNISDYTAETWSEYILSKCESYTACASCDTFQGNNSGSTGGRYWFGYVYRGGATTEADYVRDEGVTDSKAFSIS